MKRPGGLESWKTNRDYPNDSITENSQNTKKSPGVLRRLSLTQTPVKKGVNNNNSNNNNNNRDSFNMLMINFLISSMACQHS